MTLLSLCGPRHKPPLIEVTDARVRRDPTRTWRLRARMRAESDRRWQTLAQTLRQGLIEHDLLGLRGIGRLPYGSKTEGFAIWLQEELRQKIFGYNGSWLRPYVQQAANIAQTHATELAPGGSVDPSRVASMEALAVSELRGIAGAALQQITRAVTQCMMANDTPTCTANKASGVIKIMRARTRAMSEYIVAKTHSTSTLSAFRVVGVTHVGIIPERLRKVRQTEHGKVLVRDKRGDIEIGLEEVDVITAGDDNVCPVCEDISEEGPYPIDVAEGLIPAHPWCRCAFAPAGKYELDAIDGEGPGHPFRGNQHTGGIGGGDDDELGSLALGGPERNITNATRRADAMRSSEPLPLERQALDMYTADSTSFNQYSRIGDPDKPANKMTAALDQLIDKHLITDDITVYRTVGWNRTAEFLAHAGGTFSDPGFMSTTLDGSKVEKPGSYMEIQVPRGAKGFPVGSLSSMPEEAEILFPRNSELRIISHEPRSAPNTHKFIARLEP